MVTRIFYRSAHFVYLVLLGYLLSYNTITYPYRYQCAERKTGWLCAQPVKELFKDVILLNTNLFSWDSLKIIAATAPFYGLARYFDHEIHSCFYDKEHHKNKRQLHHHCPQAAAKLIAIPIVLSAGLAVFSTDEEVRLTTRIFLLGMPFLLFGKNVIKKWRSDHCLRPRNEHFDRYKVVHGGFPSGHMAEAMFATVLFGYRFGPKVAVPLSLYSVFLAATFISCNRHFTSQMVAGAGLGILYAVAANKLIDSKLCESIDVCCGFDDKGGHIKVGCTF